MSKALIFLSGAALGSIITYFITKSISEKKYEAEIEKIRAEEAKRADDDIESVKQAFQKLEDEGKIVRIIKDYAGEKDPNNDIPASDAPKEKKKNDAPYIISDNEYGNRADYELVSLIFHGGNNTLTYVGGGIVEYIEDLFDEEFLNHFGEYVEDYLYVRDPIEKIDYDIEFMNDSYNKKE